MKDLKSVSICVQDLNCFCTWISVLIRRISEQAIRFRRRVSVYRRFRLVSYKIAYAG